MEFRFLSNNCSEITSRAISQKPDQTFYALVIAEIEKKFDREFKGTSTQRLSESISWFSFFIYQIAEYDAVQCAF